MSIPVSVDQLAEALGEFGAGYLLTVSPAGRVKVLTVEPSVTDGALLVAGPSGGSAANLAANPQVTLVFPPPQPRGFTLIVDGVAEAVGDDFQVTPSAAVLHRPAAHRDGPPAPVLTAPAQAAPVQAAPAQATDCGHDCHPVT